MTPKLVVAALAVLALVMRPPDKPTFAVAPVVLNNQSPLPDTPVDSGLIVLMTHEARARLGTCGFPVIADTGGPPSGGHLPSYLFQHPEVVAQWGAAQHADWVLLSRLNRIGRWTAQWEVQVVSTRQQDLAGSRVIELKGLGPDSAMSAHLVTRGAAWVIDQSLQVVGRAGGDSTARPCRA
jgi:hypothetical protein